MNMIRTAMFCALTVVAATAAHAQDRDGGMSVTGTSIDAPFEAAAPAPQQQPLTLGRIGNLEIHVWTPVAPPYDPRADRTLAANPLDGQ